MKEGTVSNYFSGTITSTKRQKTMILEEGFFLFFKNKSLILCT